MKSWYSSFLSSLGWGRIFFPSFGDLSGNFFILFAFSNCASGKEMYTSSPSHIAAWTSHQLHKTVDGDAAVRHIGSTFYSHRGDSGFLDSIFYFFANHQSVYNGQNKFIKSFGSVTNNSHSWLAAKFPRCTMLYNPTF